MTCPSSKLRLIAPLWLAVAATVGTVLALGACGSGSNASPAPAPTPAPTPTPTTTSVPVTAIDGAISGATACLDLNDNGVCDAAEPSGVTDSAGAVTLTVQNTDAGKHAIVVMVPVGAIDADTGVVSTAYVMQAPADQSAVVSPLTTLVQAQLAATRSTSAQAAALVQAQTGLTASLFSNYTTTAATVAQAKAAATLARLIVLATQQQLTALSSSVVGQADVSGAQASSADLQGVVVRSLLGSLQALAAAAADPSVAAATTPAGVDAALGTLESALVTTGAVGLTPATALAAIGVAKLPADPPTAGVASASLRALTFTDADNWFFRANESTAADNTPDSAGLDHYYDDRTQDVAGTVSSWGFSNTMARQGDLHWNGSAWVGCPLGFRNSNTPRDANGISQYNYCDSEETGSSRRLAIDVSGKLMTDVVGTIRAFPGSDSGVLFSNFGPTDLTLLGSATFPTGSRLQYQSSQAATEAPSYIVLASGIVDAYSVAIATGGDTSLSPAPACASVTTANAASLDPPVATLDALIAASPGKPCYDGATASTTPNAWWSNSTASLGSITGAIAPPSASFTTTEHLRVSFAPSGSVVTYYSCLDSASNGSSRNCTPIGSGTYAIQTLGDARILTMSNPPAEVVRLGYARIFVERGGSVYYGYQDYPGQILQSIRLNLTAADALMTQLGMPPIVPN